MKLNILFMWIKQDVVNVVGSTQVLVIAHHILKHGASTYSNVGKLVNLLLPLSPKL